MGLPVSRMTSGPKSPKHLAREIVTVTESRASPTASRSQRAVCLVNRPLSTRDLAVLLVCIVFVAVGFTPLLSVATLGLLYLLWRVGFHSKDVLYTTLFLGCVFLFPLIATLSDLTYSPSFAVVRMLVCLTIMFFLIGKRLSVSSLQLHRYLLAFLLLLVIGAVMQRLLQFGGIYVNMPESLLGQKGSGTTVDALRVAFLRSVGILHYRPSLFYAEPSYFGLIILSLFTVMLVLSRSVKELALAAVAVIAAALASGSGYLVVTAAMMFFVSGVTRRKHGSSFGRWVLALLLVLSLVFLVISYVPMDSRLANLFGATDTSAAARVFGPWERVYLTWFHLSPFGYPIEAVEQKMLSAGLVSYTANPPLANGAINMLINFGVFGVVVFGALRLRARSWLAFTYIVLALMQNGAFGSWDKTFIVGLTCVLINSVEFAQLRRSAVPAKVNRPSLQHGLERAP
jgi:hypothetical protein